MTSWLSKQQVAELTGWTPRYIEILTARGELQSRESPERARNGRAQKEYSAASLPAEARAKLDSRQAKTSEVAIVAKADALAPLFAGVAAPAAVQAQRIALSPESERQAEERLQTIQPLLDYIANPASRSRFAQLRLTDGTPVTNSDRLATYLAEMHSQSGKKISRATIWNWKKAYATGGFNALARGIRSDKGQSKFFSRYPEAAQLVTSVYLKPYQTFALAHETLLRDHQLLGIPPCDLPSYETVRSFLDALPKPITVLARKGERAYTERMTPYLQRGYEDVAANGIWVADHMIHDVEVRNDCFDGVPENAPMRLRFSAFIDMRTRKFVGYCWAPEGNSRVITTAIRRGIERYGPPELVYCDNGKDYKKVAKGARPVSREWVEEEYTSLERTGVLQRLDVAVQFCMPYHPQSKLIERAFRTVHQKFDALFPHYTTGNAYLRPDQTTVAMAQHRKLLKMDRGNESPLVTASHFIRMATVWIEQDYNAAHSHSGRGMDGRTPDQVFDALYPSAQRRSADPAVLGQLLWETKKCLVTNTGITLNKRRYVPANPESSGVLHLANRTDVLVCYDPHDPENAIVADLDGRPIAQVQADILLPHSAEAGPAIAASMQQRRRLRNATVSTVRQIHQAVAMMGHKSDLQHLHERALLPAAVGDSIVHRMTDPRPAITPNASPRYSHDIAAEFLSEEA
jgi:transposase InsO family protein